ncbi:hypothetical protein ACA910_000141 [Epithemia clementina (nom. ined.)]
MIPANDSDYSIESTFTAVGHQHHGYCYSPKPNKKTARTTTTKSLLPKSPKLSARSTASTGTNAEKSVLLPLSPCTTNKKSCCRGKRTRVQFDVKSNQCYHDRYPRKVFNTWYNDQDYDRMRSDMRRVIQNANRSMNAKSGCASSSSKQDPSFSEIILSLLKSTTDVCHVLHDASKLITPEMKHQLFLLYRSDEKIDEKTEIAKKMSTPHLEKNDSEESTSSVVSSSSSSSSCLIGLEFWMNSALSQELFQRRETLQEIVSDIQAEYHAGCWSDAQVRVELRDSCRSVSQAFCLLAQLLAQAQHLSAL